MPLALSYCAHTLRHEDYARFLSLWLAPAEKREALSSLFSFYRELAKVKEVTTEELTGLIRLQWWREALEEIKLGQKPRAHPVVEALALAIAEHTLSYEALLGVIDAMETELRAEPFADSKTLLAHIQASEGVIDQLALIILGNEGVSIEAVARGYGLAMLLRSCLSFLRRGKCYLPVSLVKEQGIEPEQLIAWAKREYIGKDAATIEAALKKVIQEIRKEAQTALREVKSIPAITPVVGVKSVLAGAALKPLCKKNYDFELLAKYPSPLVLALSAGKFAVIG